LTSRNCCKLRIDVNFCSFSVFCIFTLLSGWLLFAAALFQVVISPLSRAMVTSLVRSVIISLLSYVNDDSNAYLVSGDPLFPCKDSLDGIQEAAADCRVILLL